MVAAVFICIFVLCCLHLQCGFTEFNILLHLAPFSAFSSQWRTNGAQKSRLFLPLGMRKSAIDCTRFLRKKR